MFETAEVLKIVIILYNQNENGKSISRIQDIRPMKNILNIFEPSKSNYHNNSISIQKLFCPIDSEEF